MGKTREAGTDLVLAGRELARATVAIILLHGRGSTAESMVALGRALASERTALLAPRAREHSWYPNSFLAPLEENEPKLEESLVEVRAALAQCAAAGIGPERTIFAGFSQGACLATEFVARHPAAYGGLFAFTGGLIGPPGADLHHEGRLDGMAALFSSGDPDPHVPWPRVEDSARELERMGARVQRMRLPGRPHSIEHQEVIAARKLTAQLEALF